MSNKYLATISTPATVITPLGNSPTFPESLVAAFTKYESPINLFIELALTSTTSAQLLDRIRSPSIKGIVRISLLKLFRRCVAPPLDTENTKKLKIETSMLVATYGHTFKNIDKLKNQLIALDDMGKSALAMLVSEYDSRGRSGYELTRLFFDWFELNFGALMTISGPRGAGPDVELSTVFPAFQGTFPCDFVIRAKASDAPLAVGFIRYDSTRGGAQSDDRTGGNSNKVALAKAFASTGAPPFRILFISDGPGLAHGDTWKEACDLDGAWEGNVRVSTLKLAPLRVTPDWLMASDVA